MHTDDAPEAAIVFIDGQPFSAHGGMTVAAALVAAGRMGTRRAQDGSLRFAVCGMGSCQECRVGIDGRAHSLACQHYCRQGMVITTGARGLAWRP